MDIQALKDEHACDLALAELGAVGRYLNELTVQVRNLRRQARRGKRSGKLATEVADLVSELRASVNAAADLLGELADNLRCFETGMCRDCVESVASGRLQIVLGGGLVGSVVMAQEADANVSVGRIDKDCGHPLNALVSGSCPVVKLDVMVLSGPADYCVACGGVLKLLRVKVRLPEDLVAVDNCEGKRVPFLADDLQGTTEDVAVSLDDIGELHDSSSLVGGCARRCAQGCGGSQPTGEEPSREGSEQ